MGDQQGKGGPRPHHLLKRHAQEVGGRQVFVEDDQDGGACAVVVGGSMGGVVAQVGREPGGHRAGAHGAALPLQEEGPGRLAPAQHAEGVGVDRAHPAEVPEVAGRSDGRVELVDLPAQVAGLGRQGRYEAVDGGGVLHVAQELAAAPAGDAAPVPGVWWGPALRRKSWRRSGGNLESSL